MSYSLRPHGLQPARLLCPWNFPGKNAGVGYHLFLQEIFPTQGVNPYLLHWQVGSLPLSHQPSSVQFSSVVQSCPTLRPHEPKHARLSITNSRSPHKPMSIKSMMPSNHLILCRSLLLLLSIFPRVFSNESALRIRWLKYWSFSFNINPSREHPGLIFFRMDWLDLLAVQGTLKSLLQYHSSKASILRCSTFFTVQLSHPYMTTEKTIALTRRTLVEK